MAEVTRMRWTTTTKRTGPTESSPTVGTFEEVTVRTEPSDAITAWRLADLADALASEGCPGSAKVEFRRSDQGHLTGLSVRWKTKIDDVVLSASDTSEATP